MLTFSLTPLAPAAAATVEPVFIPGNPSCASLGYPNELKVEPVVDGTYSATFALPDGGSFTATVTIDVRSTSDGPVFDFTADPGVQAVIVKGGPNANLYEYDPFSTSDTGLHAPVNPSNGDYFGLSHISFCFQEEPIILQDLAVRKTAAGTFDRTITWTLDKSVSPESHAGLVGTDAGSSNWTVTATKTETLGNYQASGEIEIDNPNVIPVDFSVSDVLSDGTVADVVCPSSTVPAESTLTCTWTASPEGSAADSNTAEITSLTEGVAGGTAFAPLAWTENTIGDESVTVADDRGPLGQVISATSTFTYAETFPCPSDPAMYTDGVHTRSETNTATLTGESTDLSDDAAVQVTCYAPVPSKDANASWSQTYSWEITKSADPTSHDLPAGGSGTSNYVVGVTQTVVDGDFVVSGTISVHNPGTIEMTVNVADLVDGQAATLDCGGVLVIAAGQTSTCGYSATLADDIDGTNTATVSLNGVAFGASADYAFGDPTVIGYPTITVVDTYAGTLGTASSSTSFTYSRTFPCEEFPEGEETTEYPNTATIVETQQSADALVTVTCNQVFQGLTPGFWKQSQHFQFWTQPYDPTDTLASAGFTNTPNGSHTLLQALNYGGGNTINGAKQILLRAAVAALLNAAHPDINYPLTEAEIISQVNTALASNNRGTILDLASTLDFYNNLHGVELK